MMSTQSSNSLFVMGLGDFDNKLFSVVNSEESCTWPKADILGIITTVVAIKKELNYILCTVFYAPHIFM